MSQLGVTPHVTINEIEIQMPFLQPAPAHTGYSRIQSLFYEYTGDRYNGHRHSSSAYATDRRHGEESEERRNRRGSSEVRDDRQSSSRRRDRLVVSMEGLDRRGYGEGEGRRTEQERSYTRKSPKGSPGGGSGGGSSGGSGGNSPKRRAAPAMPLPAGTTKSL